MTILQIARVCHEANAAYCRAIGDNSQVTWEMAEGWQRLSAEQGVKFALENPTTPESMHEEWARCKQEQGWVYGPVKDADAKTHPCLVPYGQLPIEQRKKDELFQSIVRALSD